MCQLLGINTSTPTDIRSPFQVFSRRGGDTDCHAHGWGICMYDGLNNTPQSYHDSDPAAESALVKSLLRSDVPVETMNMVSHIRYATRGEVKLENVHPFQRELWGVQWCFAHNGDVSCFDKAHFSPDRLYNPMGATDSEAIFCAILNALGARFDTLPSKSVLHDAIASLCDEI
ncbi:predicted protein, partial [Thalassiosira pseudonana CCMP1335]